ncbi:MAG: ammonium transporter [Alphaproteobacteria bacterium]|nr:ammonium transporter [Alphaproteobacteria bacterium]
MSAIARRSAAVLGLALLAIPFALLSAGPATAAEAKIDSANTAWILTATALVLFMTLPGLALFYGGLVRAKNVLSVLMHCFAIACLASVLWLVCVYSLSFGDGGSLQSWIGGLENAFFAGIGAGQVRADTTLPESVFFAFQMTFAIITPALIVGAFVERMKFAAVLLFTALWLILVYAPVAHWVWGGGWLGGLGVKDFAGGLVVHATAGTSAVVLVLVLGRRRGFPQEMHPPHNPGMVMIGAAMLWVGWFGFNAGSALAADASAGMALLVTHISAATASLVWMTIEWVKGGKPSLVGIVTGTIAGLATITPASGFVGPVGALAIGVLAGIVCYGAVGLIRVRLKVDDSLDVFAVHGVGGIMGTLLTAVFGASALGGMGLGDKVSIGDQLWVQAVGVVVTVAWSVILTFVIAKAVGGIVGLRVDERDETEGLDLTAHGETGYNL